MPKTIKLDVQPVPAQPRTISIVVTDALKSVVRESLNQTRQDELARVLGAYTEEELLVLKRDYDKRQQRREKRREKRERS